MNETNEEFDNEEETSCLSPLLERTSLGYRVYSAVFALTSFALAFASFAYWFKYRRLPYLKKRNVLQVAFSTIGWLASLFSGAIHRASTADVSVLNSCALTNVAYALVIIAIIIPDTVRLILFHNRVLLNQKLSSEFEKVQESRQSNTASLRISNTMRSGAISFSESSLGSSNSMFLKVKRMRVLASDKFGLFLSSFALVLALGSASLYAVANCTNDACKFAAIDTFETLTYFLLPLLIVIVFLVLGIRKVRNYPDPFGIIREIKHGLLLACFFLVPGILLSFIDPGGFQQQEPLRFEYAFLVDIGVLVFFLYTVPYQVYLAKKVGEKSLETTVSFDDIMRSSNGRSLFRKHLISEFSVENLNFYETVMKYKRLFPRTEARISERGDSSSRSFEFHKLSFKALNQSPKNKLEYNGQRRLKHAKKIFKRYLLDIDGYGVDINVSYVQRKAIEDVINSGTPMKKDLFDDVLAEVIRLMQSDSFIRFQQSAAFGELIGTIDIAPEDQVDFMLD